MLAAQVADLLQSDAGPALHDVCWTAATRRTSLEHRAAFVADDRTAMVDSLRRFAEGGAAAAQGVVHDDAEAAGRVRLSRAGRAMGRHGPSADLANEPAFLATLERCDQAARPYVDWSIIEQLSAEPGTAAYRLDEI